MESRGCSLVWRAWAPKAQGGAEQGRRVHAMCMCAGTWHSHARAGSHPHTRARGTDDADSRKATQPTMHPKHPPRSPFCAHSTHVVACVHVTGALQQQHRRLFGVATGSIVEGCPALLRVTWHYARAPLAAHFPATSLLAVTCPSPGRHAPREQTEQYTHTHNPSTHFNLPTQQLHRARVNTLRAGAA